MNRSKTDRLQSTGTILALVISIIAMFTSIYEANIMKSQQKAMVWPHLHITDSYSADGFSIMIANKGTGPALIKSVQVDYKGIPMSTMDELLDSLNPNRTFGYNILRNNTLNKYVFTPGEERIIFGLPYNDETNIVRNNLKHIRIRILYESVLEEQWLLDSEDNSISKTNFAAEKEFKN